MRLRSFVAVAAVLSATLAARAEQFSFSFSDSTYYGSPSVLTGSGLITATPDGSGEYTITSISGTTDGYTITGLDTNGDGGTDNILYYPAVSGGNTDENGIAYHFDNQIMAIYYLPSESAYILDVLGGADAEGPVTFSDVTTPEPSSFALLATGLLGLGGVMKRRFA